MHHQLILADAGYGVVTEFREALESRNEHYIVGLSGEEVVWTAPPTASGDNGHLRVHRGFLQLNPAPLQARLSQPL